MDARRSKYQTPQRIGADYRDIASAYEFFPFPRYIDSVSALRGRRGESAEWKRPSSRRPPISGWDRRGGRGRLANSGMRTGTRSNAQPAPPPTSNREADVRPPPPVQFRHRGIWGSDIRGRLSLSLLSLSLSLSIRRRIGSVWHRIPCDPPAPSGCEEAKWGMWGKQRPNLAISIRPFPTYF